MIKLVKFNLLIDGQRCRTIEDLRNNFNLLDVMEEFQNGKLEKWLMVRKYDQHDAIKAINKQSDTQKIAKYLCEIFGISIADDDLKNEVMVIEYQKLTSIKREEETAIKQIFARYYQEILANQTCSIKKILYNGKKSNEFTEILSDDIRIIPIFKRVEPYFSSNNNIKFKYKDKNKIFDCPATLKSFDEQGFLINPSILQGLSISLYDKYTDGDFIELYVLDIDSKLNSTTIKNATVSEMLENKYTNVSATPLFQSMVDSLASLQVQK